MKGKQKLNILLGTIIFAIIVLVTNKSNAGLQSNGDTPATKNVNDWMLEVRKMQTSGGTLGLSDTINESNLTSNNTNLDIHMEKNTEYGAMALLSASAYGKPDKINDGETTTGNKSGIYININKEWVAAGNLLDSVNYNNAAVRYKNLIDVAITGTSIATNYAKYTSKEGDAIEETKGWHNSGSSVYFSYYLDSWGNTNDKLLKCAGFLRSCSGSIFSYNGYAGSFNASSGWNKPEALYTKLHTSRAIIVNGSNV